MAARSMAIVSMRMSSRSSSLAAVTFPTLRLRVLPYLPWPEGAKLASDKSLARRVRYEAKYSVLPEVIDELLLEPLKA